MLMFLHFFSGNEADEIIANRKIDNYIEEIKGNDHYYTH
jgi:hypothetical protein